MQIALIVSLTTLIHKMRDFVIYPCTSHYSMGNSKTSLWTEGCVSKSYQHDSCELGLILAAQNVLIKKLSSITAISKVYKIVKCFCFLT